MLPDMKTSESKALALSRHVLTEVEAGREVRYFRMAEPGTRVMSVDLIFADGRIFISGDLRITDAANGVISALNYGVEWFVGKLGADYLAKKFLRKRHVPALAVEQVKDQAARLFEERFTEGEEPDEEAREAKNMLDAVANDGEGGRCGSSHELWELYSDLGIDTSDGVPGWGYDPNEVEWLAAVQRRFAELYAARESTSMIARLIKSVAQKTGRKTGQIKVLLSRGATLEQIAARPKKRGSPFTPASKRPGVKGRFSHEGCMAEWARKLNIAETALRARAVELNSLRSAVIALGGKWE